jgi:SAM-dependent methyltransferase
VVNAYAQPKIDFISQNIPLTGSVLDVGCGHGVFTIRFGSLGTTVFGLDTSLHLLRQNPHTDLLCGDATRLPFGEESFDIVFEANLLHHVPNRKQVVAEMARVTAKYVVLIEPNRYNPIMFSFALVVPAERGGLRSCVKLLESEIRESGLRLIACTVTGMISQNNTPAFLIPFLRRFDRQFWLGEYIIVIAEKVKPTLPEPRRIS